MDSGWLDELLGEEPKISLGWKLYVDELIRTSSIPENHKVEIERCMDAMHAKELHELTAYLQENQPCPIDNGLNYSQSDIAKKLAQLCK